MLHSPTAWNNKKMNDAICRPNSTRSPSSHVHKTCHTHKISLTCGVGLMWLFRWYLFHYSRVTHFNYYKMTGRNETKKNSPRFAITWNVLYVIINMQFLVSQLWFQCSSEWQCCSVFRAILNEWFLRFPTMMFDCWLQWDFCCIRLSKGRSFSFMTSGSEITKILQLNIVSYSGSQDGLLNSEFRKWRINMAAHCVSSKHRMEIYQSIGHFQSV